MTPFILSVTPLILFVFLLLWKKLSLFKISLLTLFLVTALAIFYWEIIPFFLGASYIKGVFVALEIFAIILGAVFFLEVLKSLKIIDSISYYLESFSKDYRIQVIVLAWFFGNFLEGTAGFGTPVAIVAPLLIGLGLSPVKAIIIGLFGNSVSGIFGAAGTPIRIGFAGLGVSEVPLLAALINSIGFIIPVFMLWVLVSDKPDRKLQFFEALPFAVWSGIAFVVPSILIVPLGQEFPSILASVIGLFLIFLSIRFGFLMPKNIRSFQERKTAEKIFPPFQTFFPYALLIIFLILGKFLLTSLKVVVDFGINHSFSLFNPGFAFIAAGLPVIFIWGKEKKSLTFHSIKSALKRTIQPFLVIASISAVVQIMINSAQNLSGFPSSIALIAKSFETSLLPFWAPFIGAFGSFLTGSVTISNIMFGNFLDIASQAMHFHSAKILALALVGGGAGNLTALADILSGEAVVGLKNEERRILKGVIVPCLVYLLLAGLIGILIV